MTSNTRFWAPFAARFAIGFTAASVAILALTPRAEAQTADRNKAAVEATVIFDGAASNDLWARVTPTE